MTSLLSRSSVLSCAFFRFGQKTAASGTGEIVVDHTTGHLKEKVATSSGVQPIHVQKFGTQGAKGMSERLCDV